MLILIQSPFGNITFYKTNRTDPVSRAKIEVRQNGEVRLAKTLLGTVGDNFTVSTEEQIKCVFSDDNLEVILLISPLKPML